MFLHLFKLWLTIINLILSFIGYQTRVDQFKSLSVSCKKNENNVFLNINAEIPDSALFLNQVMVTESESVITLTFRKRLVFPHKKIFVDKIVVSTSNTTSIEASPLLSVAWHKARINLGQMSGHFYTLKLVGPGNSRDIGHCAL